MTGVELVLSCSRYIKRCHEVLANPACVLLWLDRAKTVSTLTFLVLAEHQHNRPLVRLRTRVQSKHVPCVQILLPLAGVYTV